jgi:hypothetical protein
VNDPPNFFDLRIARVKCKVCQVKSVKFILFFIAFHTILIGFNSFEEIVVCNPLLTVLATLADLDEI